MAGQSRELLIENGSDHFFGGCFTRASNYLDEWDRELVPIKHGQGPIGPLYVLDFDNGNIRRFPFIEGQYISRFYYYATHIMAFEDV